MGLLAAGAWSLWSAAHDAAPAGAATLGGTATITNPSLVALSSGASTTLFSVSLPANAACSGDTATDGYHVYSYLVEQGTSITGLTFTTHPSSGIGLVNNTGVYYGPVNTAINTGQIISIPTNFEWAPLLSDGVTLSTLLYTGGQTGVWDTGLACATSAGVLSDYWNAVVTFTASTSDPNGFVWSDVPGLGGSTTTSTTSPGASTTTTAATTTTTLAGTSTTTTTTLAGTSTTTTTTLAGTSTTTTSTAATTTTTSTAATTTTVPGTSTTTTSAGTATSTTASGGGAVGSVTAATGDTSAVSSASGSGDPGTSTVTAGSSSLPLTGTSVRGEVAAGALCIGFGLILLGWSATVQRRRALLRAPR